MGELKASMVDGKAQAASQIERFDPRVKWKLPMNMEERVSHKLTAKVFKTSRSFVEFFTRWLKDRGLWKTSIASEILVLARSLDADMADQSSAAMNREGFEVKARRLYGYTKAFEAAQGTQDWQKPEGAAAKGWVSKVNWALLDAYDVVALEGDSLSIPAADREAAKAISEKQQLSKYLESLNGAAVTPQAVGHVISAVDSGGR